MKLRIETTGTPYDGKHERYTVNLDSYTEARHWIINNLDQSKEWTVEDVTTD